MSESQSPSIYAGKVKKEVAAELDRTVTGSYIGAEVGEAVTLLIPSPTSRLKLGLNAGKLISKSWSWDSNFTYGRVASSVTSGQSKYENFKLSSRITGHLKNFSLYSGIGVQQQTYYDSNPKNDGSSNPNSKSNTVNPNLVASSYDSESYSWSSKSAGLEIGCDSKYWQDGMYLGFIWFEVYKPVLLLDFSESRNSNKLQVPDPLTVTFKLLMFQIGVLL